MADIGTVVNWGEKASRRTKIGLFQPFDEESFGPLEDALGEGVTIYGFARLIVADKSTNQLIPTANSESIVAFGCGGDHHIHVYVGIQDDATGTSHMVHDISLANTSC
jgi:hypothetical protein